MRRRARRAAAWLVAYIVVTNLVIVTASLVAGWIAPPRPPPAGLGGIRNVATVDDRVVRGGAPAPEDFERLAAAGVTVVVDLRAEPDASSDDARARQAGLSVVHLPVRDGQTPTSRQVEEFLGVVGRTSGVVYLHCGAGVGRSGSMAAAYLVATGQASGPTAAARNLAIGPPSLEQLAYALELDGQDLGRPNRALVALSRIADGPRRLWHRIIGS